MADVVTEEGVVAVAVKAVPAVATAMAVAGAETEGVAVAVKAAVTVAGAPVVGLAGSTGTNTGSLAGIQDGNGHLRGLLGAQLPFAMLAACVHGQIAGSNGATSTG